MNFPIIVVSTYRSGSTAYSAKLAGQHNLYWFSEPHKTYERDHFKNTILSKSTNFVAKFMIDQIKDCDIYQQLLASDCYKIKLVRRNLIDQIASAYVAKVTGVWNHGNLINNPHRDSSAVPIYPNKLKPIISSTLKMAKQLNELACNFNETVYYEDLGIIENNWSISKLPSPVNITEIQSLIATYIADTQKMQNLLT